MSWLQKLFNRIFRSTHSPMIANVTKQSYDSYHRTYDTLSKVFSKLDGLGVYLIGGISAAVQTNQDLYRQNIDIDVMCKEEDLHKLINILQEFGYSIDEQRGIKTTNKIDMDGHFQAMGHELTAKSSNRNMLDIGIFTYREKGNEVITHLYAFDEKEGIFVDTEKVMSRELFDLMYSSVAVDYKGIQLKSQSKEYIYLSKSRNSREKDKLDASVIESTLNNNSKQKINKIKKLEAQTRPYKILFDKDGKISSKTKLPTLEERVNTYLDSLFMKSSTETPEQIVSRILQSNEYHKIIGKNSEIYNLIEGWKEKSKNYTYQDKVHLLTISYSKLLENFSKEGIENALDFLQQRRVNHVNSSNDIELGDEAKEVFKLMQKYGQCIKKIFVDNNIDITHITAVSPEKLEGGKLRKSINRANNYETERVDGVFASSSPINGNNPYIARNSSGMIILGDSTYIYGNDNIDVVQDAEGKKHAMLKNPNYIYHINPEGFTPVCTLTINPRTHQPVFEFSEEWISDTEIDITNPNQMRKVDEVKDVTSLLYHYTILCDVDGQGIGMKALQLGNKEKALQYVINKLNDGSIRNINREAEINERDLSEIDR